MIRQDETHKTLIRANTDEGKRGGREEGGGWDQQSECDVRLIPVKK